LLRPSVASRWGRYKVTNLGGMQGGKAFVFGGNTPGEVGSRVQELTPYVVNGKDAIKQYDDGGKNGGLWGGEADVRQKMEVKEKKKARVQRVNSGEEERKIPFVPVRRGGQEKKRL